MKQLNQVCVYLLARVKTAGKFKLKRIPVKETFSKQKKNALFKGVFSFKIYYQNLNVVSTTTPLKSAEADPFLSVEPNIAGVTLTESLTWNE